MGQKWLKKWNVNSHSSDKVYVVSESENGEWGCSCPVWKFRRLECKHIKEIRSNLNRDKSKSKIEYIESDLFEL
jgi:hypothetical protein